MLRGNIEAGDYDKFVYFLSQNHPFIDTVILVSSGGLGDEAIKIGRLVRHYFLGTLAPSRVTLGGQSKVDGYGKLLDVNSGYARTACEGPACHCASACFLIWAAGAFRDGSAIGVHRPTIQSTAFANLPPERASALYRGLLPQIANYLSDMEVPKKYIELMSATASNDIKWLTTDEALSMLEPPSIAEWVAATCGAISNQEFAEFEELNRRWRNKQRHGNSCQTENFSLTRTMLVSKPTLRKLNASSIAATRKKPNSAMQCLRHS